jgi:hypothetical protein
VSALQDGLANKNAIKETIPNNINNIPLHEGLDDAIILVDSGVAVLATVGVFVGGTRVGVGV